MTVVATVGQDWLNVLDEIDLAVRWPWQRGGGQFVSHTAGSAQEQSGENNGRTGAEKHIKTAAV